MNAITNVSITKTFGVTMQSEYAIRVSEEVY